MKIRRAVLFYPRFVISLIICVLFTSGTAFAQASSNASLTGILTDASHRVIAGAHISVTGRGASKNTGPAIETDSRDDGSFKLSVPPGEYRVTITRDAFAKVEREITVNSGQQLELSAQMEIAPMSAGIVITAQATPVETTSTSAPVTVTTRAEIEQRQINSLPNLLSTMPGFSMAQTGREGGLATLFIDGGNSNYAKVFVDGAPVNNSGGFFDFSNLTLDNVDKIEVVHGAESALYGSDAMTGVIQIFTHRGETRIPELDLEGDGGSFGTGRGSAVLSGLIGKFDYSASTSYFSTNGQGPNDFFFNRTNSGSFGWKFSNTDTLRVVVRQNTSDAGIAGQLLLLPLIDAQPTLAEHNSQHDFSASLLWNVQTGTHWRWQLTASESNLRFTESDGPPDPFTFVSADQFNRAGATAQGSYQIQNAMLTAGYEYEVENGFPSALFGEHARRNNMAGFVDARWQATKRLSLNAGARAEDNSNFGTRVVPRVGGSYLVHAGNGEVGDTRLHVFYGQGIDEPRLDQSFGSDPCFPGNPLLRPEESRTTSAGIDQGFAANRIHLSADYFYNSFHNLISFGFTPPPFPTPPTDPCQFGTGTYFNTDLAIARGVNVSGEIRLVRNLTVSGHYSYDNTLVLKAPNAFDATEMPGNHLLRRPVNSGTAEISYSRGRVSGNILGYFTGQRTDSDFLGLGFTHNPGYARIDIAASYRMQRHATAFVRVGNLFNKQYQDALGYPALGREIRVGLKLKFGGE